MGKIDDYLREPAAMQHAIQTFGNTLKGNPNLFKCAIIIDHLINASKIYALIQILPYSQGTNCLISSISGIYYRMTAEGPCAFRFSIISCMGGFSFLSAKMAFIECARGTAFRSLTETLKTTSMVIPLGFYLFCIVRFTMADVDAYLKGEKKTCCSQ